MAKTSAPTAEAPAYRAYISSTGTIIVEDSQFNFVPGEVPVKEIITYCKKGDPQYTDFLAHCKAEGWLK